MGVMVMMILAGVFAQQEKNRIRGRPNLPRPKVGKLKEPNPSLVVVVDRGR